jgi:membrane associated rhomboid family serine protease
MEGPTQGTPPTFPVNRCLTKEGFEVTFVRQNMPLVTIALILANLAVYALERASGGQAFCEAFGMIPAHFVHGGALEPLFTSLFLHDPSSLLHLGGNMVFLAFFGTIVERELGGLPFLVVYLLAGVAGGLMHVAVSPSAVEPLVGASGAIFGLIAVAAALRPRLLGFAVAFAGIEVFHAFTGGEGAVSFGCHIGGLAAGVCIVLLLRVVGSEALETA